MHPATRPARHRPSRWPALLLVATALVSCDGKPEGSGGSDIEEPWKLQGSPEDRASLDLSSGSADLTLRQEGKARACQRFGVPPQSRLQLTWTASATGLNDTDRRSVATIHLTFLGREGQPLEGPGGRVRLLTVRGDEEPTDHRAMVSTPAKVHTALFCVEIAGTPGATVSASAPEHSPIERPSPGGLPNVLVVVVDALRADALGLYGGPPEASTHIDQASAKALVYEHAWTQYTWTGPSFVSYLTSRFARSHGWTDSWAAEGATRPRPGATFPTLPDVLRDLGYVTVGLNANGYLDWLDATDLGFDQWSYEGDEAALQAAKRDLELWSRDDLPNFLYLHLMATHHPLCPSQRAQNAVGVTVPADLYRGRDNKCPQGGIKQSHAEYADAGIGPEQHLAIYRDAYRAAVWDADHRLGKLLMALDHTGEAHQTVVVFTSDHGELLGEHGRNGHGPWVWEPLTQVPLLIWGPGIEPTRRTDTVARLVDLAPTILEAIGQPDRTPAEWQGRSLLHAATPTLAVAERGGLLAATLDGHWKLLGQPGHLQAFDLVEDPGEERAMAASGQTALLDATRAWVETTPVVVPDKGEAGANPDERRELREVLEALGYVE